MKHSPILIGGGLGLYVLGFFAVVMLIGVWLRKRQGVRTPVEFKLLRGPGEELRRKLAAFDENLIFYAGGAAFVPLLGSIWLLQFWAKNFPDHPVIVLSVFALSFIGLSFLAGYYLLRRWRYGQNLQLGYLGERTVGEALMPLWKQGYHVFHDLPASAGNRKFNLDHIVVGPTGVFVIETKTRRKGRARPGHKDHEVTFDGKRFIWPWGEDRHGLDQAEAEARWASEWLNKLTGFPITAKPILALPGWYVKATGWGTVNVVNAKGVCSAVKGRGQRVLTDEQIDIIARQLDERCRDVED